MLPRFGRFYCGSCGRYSYTLRSDWLLFFVLRFWWIVPFLPPSSSFTASWRGCYHHYACRSRGPYLVVCWHALLAAGTRQQCVCLHRFSTGHSHPATFLHTPSFRCLPYRQQVTCLPVGKRATLGRLRSSTRPNLNAHVTGRAPLRSRDSRRGASPDVSPGDGTDDGPPYHHPDPQPRGSTRRLAHRTRRTNLHRTRGRLDASSCQPRESATSCPTSLSTGLHRCCLGSPPSAKRRSQAPRNLGAHAGPSDLADAAVRAQRALDDTNQMILRHEAPQRWRRLW